MNLPLHFLSFNRLLAFILILAGSFNLQAQSPKKLLANGYYEQAFADATKKQNKKVKLKSKHTDVIYKGYELIYNKGTEIISSGVHALQKKGASLNNNLEL